MEIDKREIEESIDVYLGERQKEVLKSIDFETLKMFFKANIQLGVSYFVKGDNKILNQFRAFYLANSVKGKERLKHGSRMISEYAEMLSTPGGMDDIGVDEVLFIYAHRDFIDIGNTNNWLNQTILNDVVNRKLKGYTTIILSERPIDFIEKSGQMQVLDFGIKSYKLKKSEAIQSIQIGGEVKGNDTNRSSSVDVS